MNDQPNRPSDDARYAGNGMIAAGVLIALLCGLCSLSMLTGSGAAGMLPIVAVFGGIPTLGGLLLVYLGWRKRSGK